MTYSESNSRLMLIDDRDPAVQYGTPSGWQQDTYFGYTVTLTYKPNDSLSFEFDGTRIIISALLTPNATSPAPTFNYTITNNDTTTASLTDTVVTENVAEWQFWAVLDQQGLPDGSHILNLTVLEASEENPFILDSFQFRPSKRFWDIAIAPPSDLAATVNGNETTGTTNEKGTARSSSSTPVGAIVGGVVGGLVLLGICLGCGYWFWWRRRQHLYTSLPDQRTVAPFTDTSTSSGHSAVSTRVPQNPSKHNPESPMSYTHHGYAPSTYAPSEISNVSASVGTATGADSQAYIISDKDVYIVASSGNANRAGYEVHSAEHLRSIHGYVGLERATSTSTASTATMDTARIASVEPVPPVPLPPHSQSQSQPLLPPSRRPPEALLVTTSGSAGVSLPTTPLDAPPKYTEE